MPSGTPNWSNQTIWTGDNLDIMRGMNSASVDLIYLDPPFNSKANYAAPIGSEAAGSAFKDTWGLDDVNLAWHGEIKHEHPGMYDLLNATRQIHGDSMMSYLIYMAIRLMEMRRLLKSAGSIYLHCDPTASHYIKLLMDSVFGRSRFRNEVIWKRRQDTHNLATKSMGAAHDTIFWYGDWRDSEYRRQFTPYDKSYLKSHYRHKDSRGLYRMLPCTNETGGNVQYDFRGVFRAWRFKPETMQRMFDNDLLIQLNAEGPYYYKKYLADAAGVPLQDVWFDIPPARGKERTGYPTQKPLSLIERIIMASSDPGHVVLDPFCGCATACIAAQRLQRGWVGIDISAKAADLVQSRMRDDLGIFFQGAHRTDIPKRTDLGVVIRYNDERNKRHLYGEQGGYCNGCEDHFEMRHFHVDHIIPRRKGGTDHISNLQLLCGSCNLTKGTNSQEELLVRLTDKGWIKRRKAA